LDETSKALYQPTGARRTSGPNSKAISRSSARPEDLELAVEFGFEVPEDGRAGVRRGRVVAQVGRGVEGDLPGV